MDDVYPDDGLTMPDGNLPRPWAITPMTGSTPDVGNIVGRDDQIIEYRDRLADGTNLSLVDPRRAGKTSLVRRLCNEPGERMDAVLVDFEGVSSLDDCFNRLAKALRDQQSVWSKVRSTVESFVSEAQITAGTFELKAAVATRPPAERFRDVLLAIDQRYVNEDRLLLIAMDEVPLAVQSIAEHQTDGEAALWLQQLRNLRQTTTNVRWLLAGSIGFHHVIAQVGLTEGVINDLTSVSPGPLSPRWASFLAQCLMLAVQEAPARDIEPPDRAIADAMAAQSGGFPFILHHLAHRLSTTEHLPLTADHVAAAFDEFARDRDASRALTHLLSRLGDEPEMKRVLDDLAIAGPRPFNDLFAEFGHPDGVDGRDRFLDLIHRLEDDHYLTQNDEGRYEWRYDVLRRVWVIRRNLDR